MSLRYEPKLEDIDISEDKKSLQIIVGDNYNGNIWVEIKIEDIKKVLEKLESQKT